MFIHLDTVLFHVAYLIKKNIYFEMTQLSANETADARPLISSLQLEMYALCRCRAVARNMNGG